MGSALATTIVTGMFSVPGYQRSVLPARESIV